MAGARAAMDAGGGVPVYEIPGLKGQNRGLTYLMYDMIGNLVSIYKSVSINYN